MKGEQVPLVMVPRFTTLVGAGEFATAPLDVQRFARVVLTVWRGYLLGTSPTFHLYLEVSHDAPTDAADWVQLDDLTLNDDQAATIDHSLTRRWLRVRVVLGGTNPWVTCWASGGLDLRLT